jgi:hypothetical protein
VTESGALRGSQNFFTRLHHRSIESLSLRHRCRDAILFGLDG